MSVLVRTSSRRKATSSKLASLVRSTVALLAGVGLLLVLRMVPQLADAPLALMLSYSLLLHLWELLGVAAVLSLARSAAREPGAGRRAASSSSRDTATRRTLQWPQWSGGSRRGSLTTGGGASSRHVRGPSGGLPGGSGRVDPWAGHATAGSKAGNGVLSAAAWEAAMGVEAVNPQHGERSTEQFRRHRRTGSSQSVVARVEEEGNP